MLETYTKLDGTVINLMDMPEEHKAFLQRCLEKYRAGASSQELAELVWSLENPVLQPRPDNHPTRGLVTREAYYTPLFQAVRDLLFRAEIRERLVEPEPGDLVDRDPVSDEWVPTTEAARELGISLPAVHKAIDTGRLIAKPAKEGGKHKVVSRNSIRSYHIDVTRRANGLQNARRGSAG